MLQKNISRSDRVNGPAFFSWSCITCRIVEKCIHGDRRPTHMLLSNYIVAGDYFLNYNNNNVLFLSFIMHCRFLSFLNSSVHPFCRLIYKQTGNVTYFLLSRNVYIKHTRLKCKDVGLLSYRTVVAFQKLHVNSKTKLICLKEILF